MVNWYKHDIPAWMDGTEALDDAPYRVYHVICQLIYLNEGPIAFNEHGIAGRCKQSIRTFRAALQTLFDAGKLTLADGRISNSRAKKELEKVSENRLNASKGGQKSSEVRKLPAKSLENKDLESSDASNDFKPIREEKTREEKRRKDSPDYSEEFQVKFWEPYPRKQGVSKPEAWKAWQKLTPAQREAASAAVGPYRTSVASKSMEYVLHPCRFLSQHRFEGFVNGTTLAPVFDIRAHLA